MHRLFVGFRPPAAIRAQVLGIMGGVPGARWEHEEQLHVTLRFIGEVTGSEAEDVAAALGTIRFGSAVLELRGVGQFEHRGRPGALWAGIRPREPLAALHRKLDQVLTRCGRQPERRAYFPHLTLARLQGVTHAATERFLAMHAGFVSARFPLREMLLFESRLGRGGASYEVVGRYPVA